MTSAAHLSCFLALALVATACGGDDGDGGAIDAASLDGDPLDGNGGIDAAIDGPAAPMLNGCTEMAAMDRTDPGAQRSVTFAGFAYTPRCLKVKVGQTVTWNGDLSFHPLRAGAIVDNQPMAQPGNPIPSTSAGNTVSVTFNAAGDFGYYCAVHQPGMAGAIYVVP